jgi:hypothetical protein
MGRHVINRQGGFGDRSHLLANTVSKEVKMIRLTELIKKLSSASLHRFIHQDFHEAVDRMTIIDAFLFLVKPCSSSIYIYFLFFILLIHHKY